MTKKCKVCGNEFRPIRLTTERYCSPKCAYTDRDTAKAQEARKPVKHISENRRKEIPIYRKKRKEFLEKPENKICFVGGCGKRANTIEHTRGRRGFADEWARDNKVSLYIDQRFWKACCLDHNLKFENDPELSKKYQLSKLHGEKK
jgi:hypothetical protein